MLRANCQINPFSCTTLSPTVPRKNFPNQIVSQLGSLISLDFATKNKYTLVSAKFLVDTCPLDPIKVKLPLNLEDSGYRIKMLEASSSIQLFRNKPNTERDKQSDRLYSWKIGL